MSNTFCPFAKSDCRDDCVFRCPQTVMPAGTTTCLIAAQLVNINEHQCDQLHKLTRTVESGLDELAVLNRRLSND